MDDALASRRPLVLGALFLGALALRALYVVLVFDDPVRYPVLDAHAYHEWALRILAGDWLGDAVYYQDPLYPFFLAGLYALFGPDSIGVPLAQAALGAGSVALLAATTWRLFGAGPALVAGSLAATYLPFLFYEALLLKAPLLIFLFTALAYALVRAAEGFRSGPWLAAGLVLGLAALTRGNALLFLPGLWLWLALRRQAPAGARVRAAALAGVGVALVLLPIGLRNWVVGGDLVWINSQGGQNFYIGNVRSNGSGMYRAPPFLHACPQHEERDFRRVAQAATGRAMRPSEISSYWLEQGLAEIRADPAHFVAHTARKLAVLVNHYEVPDNYSFAFFRERVALLRTPLPTFAWILPLAVCGFVFARRDPRMALLGLFVLAYAAGILLFFNLSRLRLPMLPVLLIAAGLGGWRIAELARARDWRPLGIALAGCAAGFAIARAEIVRESPAIRFYNLGQAHLVKVRADRDRAVALSAAGNEPEARRVFALASEGRDRAEAEYRAGLEQSPGSRRLRNGLRELSLVRLIELDRMQDYARAVPLAESLASEYPDRADVQLRLGIALARVGRADEAVAAFDRTLAVDPENRRARMERLRILMPRNE